MTWSDDGFGTLVQMFLAWTPDVQPLAPSQLDSAPNGDRFLNGMSLDINNIAPGSVWGVGD